MARRKSRAEVEIEAQLRTLDPDSKRHAVLTAARDFKAAWVVLGDLLTEVRESDTWRTWGYASFDAYCRRELHLRRDTANKLTRSYAFLRDHEPEALAQRTDRELPPLDVVDLLSRAQEHAKVSRAQLDTIREEVFDPEGEPLSRSQVVKRFRELDPEAFRPAPRKPAVQGDVRKALLLAERLLALVEVQEGMTPRAVDGVRVAVGELRNLFEAQRADEAANDAGVAAEAAVVA